MTNYSPTIGLEIHIELKTKTKMFCGCLNDADEKHPNINVCPICLAHPGVLPVINKKAVESVLKLGLALNSKIPEISKFDRKNYFYPDLPKGYQISQYDKPLVVGGKLNGVKITRIHLEEDTGRLTHSHRQKSSYSLVDFNRAGIPLMELVTEPDIKSGEEAVKFAKELQLILRYLEISDADMEKGQMRVEVNISISDKRQGTSDKELGTKVEIKNLNSFRAVEESIDYEIKRQPEILDKGEEIKQETRGWDDIKKRTVSQRLKEESHDYRYFPEPDLPPLDLTKFNLEELKVSIPELPAQKRARFIKEYGLLANQTEILIEDRGLAQYFEESASELRTKLPIPDYQLLFNYFSSDTRGLMNEQKITVRELNITPENFADLIVLLSKGEISSRSAKDILKEMFLTGLDPRQIIR
ncbi:Asp-tRNA(Asn)/Glu-tRNA(Gln) amidotransferase subunit GatB, partial [Candidatus Wolfebacteria bacterium]|nr:Asp-tRNA(Asn)/Glu-tRNA(Gln) amidotransferase subunit GatB [Candidatus Wolfebacteria bacterium]